MNFSHGKVFLSLTKGYALRMICWFCFYGKIDIRGWFFQNIGDKRQCCGIVEKNQAIDYFFD
jgi:hypothetical protein